MKKTTSMGILKVKGASIINSRCSYNAEAPSPAPSVSPAPKSPRCSHGYSITLEDILKMGSVRMESEACGLCDKSETRLSYMTSALLATALEDFLTSIRIIGASQSLMRQLKAKIDMTKLLAKKYGIETPVATNELAGVTKENIDCEDFKLNKMVKDREHMENVITATYRELAEECSYSTLINTNNEFEMQTQRAPSIRDEIAKNRALRTKLRRQLRLSQQRNAVSLAAVTEKVEKLQLQLEENHLLGNIKGQFVSRWQAARTEQHQEIISSKEQARSDNIFMYKMKQEEESRVHVEMELMVSIIINEMLAQIEDLMTKYEKDTEQLDLKIQKARNKYEEMAKSRIYLEKKAARRHQEMLMWTAFKEERIRGIEYERKMEQSALVIQAWWRGLCVRHKLGPYRPRKGRRRNSRIRKKSTASTMF